MVTKEFRPTSQMVLAAELVFAAMAHTAIVRPIVEGYQKKVLERHRFMPARRWRDLPEGNQVIIDPARAYLMDRQAFTKYLREVDEERKEAGLHIPVKGMCPLLVAEQLEREAKGVLVDTMAPVSGIKRDDVLCMRDGLTHYAELVDLTLRLLAPYCRSGEVIIKELFDHGVELRDTVLRERIVVATTALEQ